MNMTQEREGTMKRLMQGLLAASAILAAVPVSARAQDYDSYDRGPTRIDTVVPFSRGGTVELSLLSGRIKVTGWDRQEVKVLATSEHAPLRFSASENRVSLEVERRGGEVQYDVTVPRGTRLSLESLSGTITATGVGGEIEAQSVSGSVQVNDAVGSVDAESVSGGVSVSAANGNVTAQSTSGSVAVRNVTGDIEAESVSGGIALDGIRSSSVRTETVSGPVTYTGSIDAGGRYSFVTHSGVLRLNLPASVGAVFSVETYSGDIDSDFPVTMQPGQGRNSHDRFEFTIGDGKARVSAENFSGKIIINRVGDANDRRND
jgi:hypothetical protein